MTGKVTLCVLLLLLLPAALTAANKMAGNALQVPTGYAAVGETCDAATGLPLRIRHVTTGYELVYVPAGSFLMGAPEDDDDADPCEQPQTQVYVPGFWIGRTEVSNAQYRQFFTKHRSGEYRGHTLDGENQPVVNVSWQEAVAFCQRTGMRLPTEAEWEKAARGTDGRRYAAGAVYRNGRPVANVPDSAAVAVFGADAPFWPFDDGFAVSAPVGSFPDGASPYGALDMTGNVSEWTSDGWDERIWQFITAVLDIDPAAGRRHRIYRDGSYLCDPHSLLVTSRGSYPLDHREYDIGFRAAVSPVAGTTAPVASGKE